MFPAFVVLVLAQSPESPPPLVEAEVSAESQPSAEPQGSAEPQQEPERQVVASDLGGAPTAMRFAASFAGALAGGVPSVVLIAGATKLCGGHGDCEGWTYVAAVALAPLLVGIGGYAAEHLAGGKGTFGKAMAGAAIGLGTGLVVVLIEMGADKHPTLVSIGTTVGIAAGCAAGITAAMLEYSHRTNHDVAFAVIPVNGGAMASVGGRF